MNVSVKRLVKSTMKRSKNAREFNVPRIIAPKMVNVSQMDQDLSAFANQVMLDQDVTKISMNANQTILANTNAKTPKVLSNAIVMLASSKMNQITLNALTWMSAQTSNVKMAIV